MSAEYVRRTYGVTYKRGDRVTVDGKPGTVVSFPGHYLGVRFDGDNHTSRAHPTWRVARQRPEQAEAVRRYRTTPDPLAYSVDRSYGNVRHHRDSGDMQASDWRKLHRPSPADAGHAACSRRVLLNNLGAEPGQDPATVPREALCRRCFPDHPEEETA